MRIILSRKGFDSGSGGCASPIVDGVNLVSLPIPDDRCHYRYDQLSMHPDMAEIVPDLSAGKVSGSQRAHLDPDLDLATVRRSEGWKPAFGQSGAAQAHLEAQNVQIGDVFIFFGWFRDAARDANGKWSFTRYGRNVHAVFGWLQIGDIIRLPTGKREEWSHYPWLEKHPHVDRGPDAKNVVYVASSELVLPDIGATGVSGAGTLSNINDRRILTDPMAKNRSTWRLPAWFKASKKCSPLSYHSSPHRWQDDGDKTLLKSVARGQEFVLDCENRPQASGWLMSLING